MSYRTRIQDLYAQVQQGKILESFDAYYAEDVVMTEPRGTRTGKAECRAYEEQFLSNVEEFHSLEVISVGSDEDAGTTFVESTMDITFKEGGRVQMEQVAVQKWRGDQITHERFYYNNEH